MNINQQQTLSLFSFGWLKRTFFLNEVIVSPLLDSWFRNNCLPNSSKAFATLMAVLDEVSKNITISSSSIHFSASSLETSRLRSIKCYWSCKSRWVPKRMKIAVFGQLSRASSSQFFKLWKVYFLFCITNTSWYHKPKLRLRIWGRNFWQSIETFLVPPYPISAASQSNFSLFGFSLTSIKLLIGKHCYQQWHDGTHEKNPSST